MCERSGEWNLINDSLSILRAIEPVGKPVLLCHHVGPHRFSAVSHFECLALSFAVAEEGSVLVCVDLLGNEQEQLLVVLEMVRELDNQLPHTIQVLDEHWRPLIFLEVPVENAESEMELMSEANPVFVDKDKEAFNRSIVGINHLLWKGAHLGCPVPTI